MVKCVAKQKGGIDAMRNGRVAIVGMVILSLMSLVGCITISPPPTSESPNKTVSPPLLLADETVRLDFGTLLIEYPFEVPSGKQGLLNGNIVALNSQSACSYKVYFADSWRYPGGIDPNQYFYYCDYYHNTILDRKNVMEESNFQLPLQSGSYRFCVYTPSITLGEEIPVKVHLELEVE